MNISELLSRLITVNYVVALQTIPASFDMQRNHHKAELVAPFNVCTHIPIKPQPQNLKRCKQVDVLSAEDLLDEKALLNVLASYILPRPCLTRFSRIMPISAYMQWTMAGRLEPKDIQLRVVHL